MKGGCCPVSTIVTEVLGKDLSQTIKSLKFLRQWYLMKPRNIQATFHIRVLIDSSLTELSSVH